MARKKLGEILIAEGVLDESRLRAGLDILEESVAAALGVPLAESKNIAFVNFGGVR